MVRKALSLCWLPRQRITILWSSTIKVWRSILATFWGSFSNRCSTSQLTLNAFMWMIGSTGVRSTSQGCRKTCWWIYWPISRILSMCSIPNFIYRWSGMSRVIYRICRSIWRRMLRMRSWWSMWLWRSGWRYVWGTRLTNYVRRASLDCLIELWWIVAMRPRRTTWSSLPISYSRVYLINRYSKNINKSCWPNRSKELRSMLPFNSLDLIYWR